MRAATRRSDRGRRGFTLIEILMAMMIFLAGITGILALFSTALALHREGLSATQVARQLDGIAARVQREVAAGQHRDAATGRWTDVEQGRLEDGTVYAVQFVELDPERLLVRIRASGTAKGLGAAEAVPYLLGSGPGAAAAVERYRKRYPAGSNP